MIVYRKIKKAIQSNLLLNPFIYSSYLLLKLRWRELTIFYNNDYDVLVDGYPRSSNTYTWYMFLISQKHTISHGIASVQVPRSSGVKLKGHIHIAAFVIHAAQHQKPICFLIRRPDKAIVSWHIAYHTDFEELKGDNQTLEERLDYYIAYHKAVLPYKKSMYIANFDRTTKDFKSVVAGLIEHYGLELSLDFDSEATDLEAKKQIHLFNTTSSGNINMQALHLPSESRAAEQTRLTEELNSSKYAVKLAEAWRLYQEFN